MFFNLDQIIISLKSSILLPLTIDFFSFRRYRVNSNLWWTKTFI